MAARAKRASKVSRLPYRGHDRVERALAPFFRDAALWPVTFVVLAHFALGIALLLLDAVRGPGPIGLATLALVLVVCADVLRRDLVNRRVGFLGATVIASLVLGAIAAFAGAQLGLY
ncbi:MAG TPA: hypothetical protein VMW35_17460 [Myxococcota bacterium]|jgi:hypothetical protein|nr:hypothetical protein [Myxococcota bacterium]